MEEVGRIKDRDFCVSRYQSVFGIEPLFGIEPAVNEVRCLAFAVPILLQRNNAV